MPGTAVRLERTGPGHRPARCACASTPSSRARRPRSATSSSPTGWWSARAGTPQRTRGGAARALRADGEAHPGHRPDRRPRPSRSPRTCSWRPRSASPTSSRACAPRPAPTCTRWWTAWASTLRIGRAFLSPGPGFGGSCFPSQVRALPEMARSYGIDAPVIASVHASNMGQADWLIDGLEQARGHLGRGRARGRPGPDLQGQHGRPPGIAGAAARGAARRAWRTGGRVRPGGDATGRRPARRGRRGRRRRLVRGGRHRWTRTPSWWAPSGPSSGSSTGQPCAPTMRGRVIADGRKVVDVAAADAAGLTVVTLGVAHAPACPSGRSRSRCPDRRGSRRRLVTRRDGRGAPLPGQRRGGRRHPPARRPGQPAAAPRVPRPRGARLRAGGVVRDELGVRRPRGGRRSAGTLRDRRGRGASRWSSCAGEDDVVRAFHNVCRHRGSLHLHRSPTGRIVRFQCPYHAWTYELDGRLRRASHTDDPGRLRDRRLRPRAGACGGLAGLRVRVPRSRCARTWPTASPTCAGHLDRFPLADLRRARRIEYDVDANWKVIGENYSECYHCPGVHPQLNRLTPYDQGQNLESDGPWCGGWMELRDDFDTMSLDGLRHGRPPLPGVTPEDERRIYYFLVWPNLLLSLHPDYLMTHQVWPVEPGARGSSASGSFHPDTMARAGLRPVRRGRLLGPHQPPGLGRSASSSSAARRRAAYTPGRYSLMEDMVHAFDLMVADGYAAGRRRRPASRRATTSGESPPLPRCRSPS